MTVGSKIPYNGGCSPFEHISNGGYLPSFYKMEWCFVAFIISHHYSYPKTRNPNFVPNPFITTNPKNKIQNFNRKG